MVEQAMFRAPFLAQSSFYGGKQRGPKEGCLVTQGVAKLSCCSSPGKSDHRPWAAYVQVRDYSFQCIHNCCFATLPLPQDLRDVEDGNWYDLRWIWFIVREACAAPVSLSRHREPYPAARQSRDSWRPAGMQKLLDRGEFGTSLQFVYQVYSLAFDRPRPACKAAGDLVL